MRNPSETMDEVKAYLRSFKKPAKKVAELLAHVEEATRFFAGRSSGDFLSDNPLSKNDILDLQLKYKNDQQVLDLVSTLDDLQERLNDADEVANELSEAQGEIGDLKKEAMELEAQLEDAQATISRLEDENESLDGALTESGWNLV